MEVGRATHDVVHIRLQSLKVSMIVEGLATGPESAPGESLSSRRC